jgi:uncharacterized membrane protein
MPLLGEICALASSACWAVGSLLFARAGRDAAPFVLNAIKCGIGFALLALTTTALEGAHWFAAFGTVDVALLALSGLLGLTVGDTLYFESLIRLGPRRALLLLALSAPLTAILAAVMLGEGLGPMAVLGIAVTTAGVAWVVAERAGSSPVPVPVPASEAEAVGRAGGAGTAVLLGLAGAFAQAIANVLTRSASADHPAIGIGSIRIGAAVLGLLVHVLAVRGSGAVWRTLAAPRTMKYLGTATVLSTFLGIWLASAGVRYAPAGVAATLSSTAPVFVLPLAWFALGERLSLRAVLGAAVAVSGIALLFVGGAG